MLACSNKPLRIIDDVLSKEAGCSSELDYPEQSSIQEVIVAQLGMVKEKKFGLEALFARKMASLTELKQSLLQKAFTGQLTADWRKQQT